MIEYVTSILSIFSVPSDSILNIFLSPSIYASTIRNSVPLILAAMAGLFAERSGVVDIGLEGKLTMGAFSAATFAALAEIYGWGNGALIGLIMAIIICMFFSAIHGFASITMKGDQVVSGFALNILAVGLSVVLGSIIFDGMNGQTPLLREKTSRFLAVDFSFIEKGSWLQTAFFSHNILTYSAFLIVPVVWFVVFKTTFGLRLRATGENPQASDTAGISVTWIRYRALLIGGALCGIAGAWIATGASAQFSNNMSANRGYIALAALIFGKWKPANAFFACLFFGFLDAFKDQLGSNVKNYFGSFAEMFPNFVTFIDSFIIPATPYMVTVLVLMFAGKSIAPSALGTPYKKER